MKLKDKLRLRKQKEIGMVQPIALYGKDNALFQSKAFHIYGKSPELIEDIATIKKSAVAHKVAHLAANEVIVGFILINRCFVFQT